MLANRLKARTIQCHDMHCHIMLCFGFRDLDYFPYKRRVDFLCYHVRAHSDLKLGYKLKLCVSYSFGFTSGMSAFSALYELDLRWDDNRCILVNFALMHSAAHAGSIANRGTSRVVHVRYKRSHSTCLRRLTFL